MNEHTEAFTDDPRSSARETIDAVVRTADPLPLETLVNEGRRRVNAPEREVHVDEHWRGFFPSDHVVSAANRFLPLPAGFHKRFRPDGDAYVGETTDADGVVTGHNRIRETEHEGRPYGVVLSQARFHRTAWACNHVSAVGGSTRLKQFEYEDVRRCTSLKTRSTECLKPCCSTR
jgi:hypothetical protein